MASSTAAVSSQELLDAQSQLWNHTFGFINSFSLRCAVELGIADAIHSHGDKPMTLSELTAALNIAPARIPCFQRFMRLLVHSGFFSLANDVDADTEGDSYTLTPLSSVLIKSKGTDISPFLHLMMHEAVLSPWQYLSSWFKVNEPATPFEMAHGMNIWQATGKMPVLRKLLLEGVESDSGLITKVVLDEYGDQLFAGVKSLVEVAGASGLIARTVAEAYPQTKCSVLDLPHVIANIDKRATRVEFIAGDMFEYIPPADVMILKWVLHCWNDEQCVKILQRCREATPPKEDGGKVIVIDKVLKTEVGHPKLIETQLHFDMHVMVHTPGKQRNEGEWKKLFIDAGFKDYKITPALGLRSIIEVYH